MLDRNDRWIKELCDFWDFVTRATELDDRYQVDSTGWKKESHLPYTADINPMHVLNLYYPADYDPSKGKLKTIIDIHGGGWMFGTVDVSERYLGWLAAQGYAVMGMNYRFLQETDLKGIVQDVAASMQWLGAYGPERGFDLDHVLVTGDSAGGHLSNLIACIQQSEELQKIYEVEPLPYDITALCVCCPCAELDWLFILDNENTERGRGTARAYRSLMLGDAGEKAPWKGHMSASETLGVGKIPPVLVIGSESDSLHEHTKMLLSALDQFHQTYETLIWKKSDGPHLFHVFNVAHWEWRESIISNRKTLEFFERICERRAGNHE